MKSNQLKSTPMETSFPALGVSPVPSPAALSCSQPAKSCWSKNPGGLKTSLMSSGTIRGSNLCKTPASLSVSPIPLTRTTAVRHQESENKSKVKLTDDQTETEKEDYQKCISNSMGSEEDDKQIGHQNVPRVILSPAESDGLPRTYSAPVLADQPLSIITRGMVRSASQYKTDSPIFLRDLKLRNGKVPEFIQPFVSVLSELSIQCFSEDVMNLLNKESKWRLCVLLSADYSSFLGFMTYQVKPNLCALEIGKFAVPEDLRGKGYGAQMLKEILKYSNADPNIAHVCLSSLPGSVQFYRRFGFKKRTDVTKHLTEQQAKKDADGDAVSNCSEESQITSISQAYQAFDEFTISPPSPSSIKSSSRIPRTAPALGAARQSPALLMTPGELSPTVSIDSGCSASELSSADGLAVDDVGEWDFVEGQVFMEFRCRRQGKNRQAQKLLSKRR